MRLFKYDVVRAIACMFVVMVHARAIIGATGFNTYIYYWGTAALFFTCNAIFFMMSGRFNIKKLDTDLSIKQFYYKKVKAILLPVAIIFFFRTLVNMFPDYSAWGIFSSYIKNSLWLFSSTEYWFVFSLVSFLLATPFFASVFMKLGTFGKKAFIAIGLAINACAFFMGNLGYGFSWATLFTGFSLMYCIGPFIEEFFEKTKSFVVLELLALASLVLTVYFAMIGWNIGTFDTSPFHMILSVGVYVLILRLGEHIKGPICKPISFIAKHSFSIYLVHMVFLKEIAAYLPYYTGWEALGAHLLFVLVVFILSLACATILDKLIIDPAKKLFDYALTPLRKRIEL